MAGRQDRLDSTNSGMFDLMYEQNKKEKKSRGGMAIMIALAWPRRLEEAVRGLSRSANLVAVSIDPYLRRKCSARFSSSRS